MAKNQLKKQAAPKKGKALRLIVHQSLRNAQFYITIKAANNKIIFDGGEGYIRSESAYKNLNRLIEQIKSDNFEVIDGGTLDV